MKLLLITSNTINAFSRDTLLQSLRASGMTYEVVETNVALDETIRKRLTEGWDCVAAAGGDGMVAAVAHTLIGTDTPLGILPLGTGNLVARELGIPLEIADAVNLLADNPKPKPIDAMRITGKTYLLNAGVGVNAEVIDQTSRLGKSLFGRTAYVGTAVWKALQAKTHKIEITIDGETHTHSATDVLISNCGILARALYPNGPDIRADDGLLDIGVIRMKSPLEYPWYYLLRWIAPKRVNTINIETTARQSVTIRCHKPIVVQADGDVIGTTPVTIELLPLAVTILVPR
jgi:diacylglycerol kinase family enzyme